STVTPSWEETEKSPAYRASRCDLKTCTCLRAMTARRTRRINSSDLPLNITPEMTSIHPGRLACWNMGPDVTPPPAHRATDPGGTGEGWVEKVQQTCGFSGYIP